MALSVPVAAYQLNLSNHYRADTKNINKADKGFAVKAAQGGASEVALGKLAQQNGVSQGVRDFGKKMETDHSKANQELMQTASNLGLTLPTTPDKIDQKTYDKLSKLHGAAFDKAYQKDMVADHNKDIKEFEKEAKSGKVPELKAFAQRTLPTLREHLSMAKTMTSSNTTKTSSSHNMEKMK